MRKKFILWQFVCLLSIVMGHNALAVPAVPWPVEKIQPDGSKITVYLRGDEKVHWMESLDGYTLMYDAQKNIVYAEQDANKNMVPSKNKYNVASAVPSGITKGIRYSQSQTNMLKQIWEVTGNDQPQRAKTTTGSRKALCILMGFQDKPFLKPESEFETLFNQENLYPADNTSKGSVRDFYRENSYGQLDFTVTIVGPYTADNNMIYYANQTNDAGYRWFAEEAARKADADVDYNDFADDGVLESFHILFAGYGDENINNGQQIWSHEWAISPAITLDGVKISTYSCSPELRGSSGNNTTYIGVICHELGHALGAPDYYDTSTSGVFTGSGNWDLMANGSWNDNGRQPSHHNMFQKMLYGWVSPVELTSYTEINDMPPSAQEAKAYTIKANTNGEMYVLENRQQIGFDTSIPGHGLLVWHVHQNALNGNGSNAAHPQQLYPVVASSTYPIPTGTVASYGNINSGGAPFPGTTGNHTFSAKTTPTMFTWAGLQPIAKPLTEITENADKTVSFKFMDGPTVPVTDLQAEEIAGNVKLTWTAADHPDVLGYKIYRDGILIYTINNKETTTYTQIGVINGTYVYGVSAFYESTESTPATANITITTGSDAYSLPVANLQGRTTLNRAYLNWDRPFNGGWMTIAESADGAYNFGVPLTFFAGTLWGPDQLKGLDGYTATQFQFYLNETTTGVSYQVQVYEVDDTGTPVLVRDQAYTQSPRFTAGAKTVTFTSPLAIDPTKEYIFGVQMHTLGGNCLVVDANPALPERNWINIGDAWGTLDEVGVTENFYTLVYLNSGNPSSPNPNVVLDGQTKKAVAGTFVQKMKASSAKKPLLKVANSTRLENAGPSLAAPALDKYIVYRDGVEIGQSTTTSFEDGGLAGGTTYSYCISAHYNNGNASEGACIELTTLSPVNAFNPVENLTAKSAGDEIAISWDSPYMGGTATYVTSTAAPTSSTVNAANFTEAIRFEPNDMKRMEGYNITKVRFNPGNSTTARTYTIQIWSGGNGTTPGELVYEQPATFANNAWTDITLDTPVPVNIYEDLWIGVKVTRTPTTGNIPSPRYASGVVNGKSNLYNNGTSWTTTANVVWPVSAIIEAGEDVAELTGYTISRDGDHLADLPASTLSYSDEGLEPGDYNYCVTAVYGANESEPVCASATAETPVSPYKPVDSFGASLDDNKVTLNWTAPFAGGFFGHSALTSYNSYNITAGIMTARFTKDDLKKLNGTTKLTRVYFATHSSVTTSNTSYTLRIYTGAKGDEPEKLVYSQAITGFGGGGWHMITLTTPFDMNIYDDLWIGIEISMLSNTANTYRATTDPGPAIDGKGNVLYYNGVWTTLLGVTSGTGDYNWAILGWAESNGNLNAPAILSHDDVPYFPENIVSESDFKSVPFNKGEAPVLSAPLLSGQELKAPQVYATPNAYRITRNGEDLATVDGNALTYEDLLSATGDYNYCVTAQYDGDQESEARCADVSFVNECDAKPENVTISYADNVASIDWDFTPIFSRETLLNESFENGIPATWGNVDADGDSYKWAAVTGTGATGTGFVMSESYRNGVGALHPDNWLITPAITLTGNSLLSYAILPDDPSYPAEHYGVYISTTDANPASFTSLYEETLGSFSAWQNRTVDLSDYEGQTVYIAFRHYNCSDQFQLLLDDVNITGDANPSFNIYENGVKIDQVTGKHYERTLPDGRAFNYCVSFAGSYCESETTCAALCLQDTWVGTSDNDWNNPENWSDGLPGEITVVTISGNAPHFPVLTEATSVAEIHFEPGAQLGGQSYLSGKAFVSYDLSNREIWNMLSIPLKQVYPGDFTFGGYPQTWVRTFSAANEESSIVTGSWTTLRSSSIPFTFGDGFILSLNKDDNPDYPVNATKGLKLLNDTRELPFFQHQAVGSPDKELYDNVHQTHDYDAETGVSTFFNVKLVGDQYERNEAQLYTVTRQDANQLAGANVSKALDFEGGIYAMLGNPYMATLDFVAFNSENSDIKRSYYVWTSNGYTIFTPSGAAGATVDNSAEQLIAPLQGFIVEKQETAPNEVVVSFNENMTTANPDIHLRSSVNQGDKLSIIARNPVAGFSAFIAKREGGQDSYGNMDARKIMNEISDVPEVYTLKPYKSGLVAVGANIIDNDDLLIPVGLATSYTGDITLSFKGMDTYNAEINFIDVKTGEEINLTGLASYDYVVNYIPEKVNGTTAASEDRFFIRISKVATGIKDITDGKVNVYETDGLVRVISGASNPIKEVAVYDLQGVLMYKATAVNAISHTIRWNWSSGVYIVKVTSEKNIDNVKLVVK